MKNEYTDLKNKADLELDSLSRTIIKEKNNILEKISKIAKENTSGEIQEEYAEEDIIDSEEHEIFQNLELTKDDEIKAYNQLNRTILFYAERKIKKQSITIKSLNGKIIGLIQDIFD